MGTDDDYERLLGGLTQALAEPKRTSASEPRLVPPLPS
jgi:hypothetical protein